MAFKPTHKSSARFRHRASTIFYPLSAFNPVILFRNTSLYTLHSLCALFFRIIMYTYVYNGYFVWDTEVNTHKVSTLLLETMFLYIKYIRKCGCVRPQTTHKDYTHCLVVHITNT